LNVLIYSCVVDGKEGKGSGAAALLPAALVWWWMKVHCGWADAVCNEPVVQNQPTKTQIELPLL